ncbi:MAG: glycine betaine ABC transporter substrate-binding protein [Leptospirales bacterium]|jgi:osmoprotectant transport system permease protein
MKRRSFGRRRSSRGLFAALKRSHALICVLALVFCQSLAAQTIRVGSKHFTESYVLGEIMAQRLEALGFRVERRHNLGGTLICYEALATDEIDLYPEYTGTISEAILKLPARESARDTQSDQSANRGASENINEGIAEINRRLAPAGLRVLSSFGFNNTYAFVVPARLARKRGLKRISDLRDHPGLRLALSYEFLDRGDGWRPLRREYRLPQTARGIEHGIAYRAIADNRIDLTDAYSTDAEIERYDLVALADDRAFFPEYLAVPFMRADLPPRAFEALAPLKNILTETQMRALNARVSVDRVDFRKVAFEFLRERDLLNAASSGAGSGNFGTPDTEGAPEVPEYEGESRLQLFFSRLGRHIFLTVLALAGALAFAAPLGVLVYRRMSVARPTLYIAGLLQTVPSIALLAFMIPLFGIGVVPAVAGLLLYAILPILRTTITALQSVDPLLVEVATGMGLTRGQTLWRIELPLALPGLFAGVRVATVIAIGTATLAAFIGAGGLGEPIVTGLALNDPVLILEGALPAAGLAIAADVIFDRLERAIVPAHLRGGGDRNERPSRG